MQYPNRSINSLKKMLQKNLHYNEIIFIDNEKIFKIPLLQGKDFHNFFTDQFAGDFGHCTELGNTLIAKNVAKTILKLYN